MRDEMIRLTGLWENKSQEGGTYLVGRMGSVRFLVFPNKWKRSERAPDHYLYLAAASNQNQHEAVETQAEDTG